MASADTINAPFTNIFYEDQRKFDVFLSFTGSDIRRNFIDHLFTAMTRKGISTFREDETLERGNSIVRELLITIEESKIVVVVFSRNYAFSVECLAKLAKIVEFMEMEKLIVVPVFYNVDPRDVRNQTGDFAAAFARHEEHFRDNIEDVNLWRLALRKAASISGLGLNNYRESQLVNQLVESLCNLSNQMPEDGSTNWDSPPRFDVTPDESDDADEMVQDYVADLPLCPIGQIVGPSQIGLENESLPNLSNREVQLIHEFIESLSNWMPEDGSTNWNLPPRFDVTPDESDDADDDANEMVQDYVADLPLEVHVVPDDVADVPQVCPVCVTNTRNMAFLCGHMICEECGVRLDTCHICRKPISGRIRLFSG